MQFGVEAMFFIVTPDRAQLTELAGLVDAGRLQRGDRRHLPAGATAAPPSRAAEPATAGPARPCSIVRD